MPELAFLNRTDWLDFDSTALDLIPPLLVAIGHSVAVTSKGS